MARLLLCVILLTAGMARADSVVFIEGLGGGPRAFEEVMATLRGEVPLFFKPRPERMPGDEDGGRSPTEAAHYLRGQLRRAKVAPPFIVVGHSLGGAQALAFARAYPEDVSGVLLLDPRLPSYTPGCKAAGQRFCDFTPEGLAKRSPQQQREYLGLAVDTKALADASWLGQIPLTVLGAARPAPGLPTEWQSFWLDHLLRYTATAPNGRFLPVMDSGHMIQKQRPDLVLDEIRRLLHQ